jgi:hypothetical protein
MVREFDNYSFNIELQGLRCRVQSLEVGLEIALQA